MNEVENRYQRMNQFLTTLKEIALENPTLSFEEIDMSNAIYRKLIHFGVEEEDKKENLSQEGMFSRFIRRYETNPNIQVFVAENWRYFCQFTNHGEAILLDPDAIKMYIPLRHDHIEKGAHLLFDYLAQKDVTHLSKIGKQIRCDDIVIRLKREEDAKDLWNFVQNNPYLLEGMIPANPFVFSKGNVAFAMDGSLSYNKTISELIRVYMEEKQKENSLDSIQLGDFVRFSQEYYQTHFEDSFQVEKVLSDFGKEEDFPDEVFFNIKQVLKLFNASLDPSFTLEDYMEYYREASNKEQQRNELSQLQKAREAKVQEDMRKLLAHSVQVMSAKYGKESALKGIEAYLLTGNERYLTRDGHVREQMKSFGVREHISSLLQDKGMSIQEYWEEQEQEEKNHFLKKAVLATYHKYEDAYQHLQSKKNGFEMASGALHLLISYGMYNGFTRDQNARSELTQNVSREEAIDIMRKVTGLERKNSSSSLEKREVPILVNSYFQYAILQEEQEKREAKEGRMRK